MTSLETAGKALKALSDKLAEDMKRREANYYIFRVQISCTFPVLHYYLSPRPMMMTIPARTLKSPYTFSSIVPREVIKEKILKVEEDLIKTYEEEIMRRYGVKYDHRLERIMEYELEVQKAIA